MVGNTNWCFDLCEESEFHSPSCRAPNDITVRASKNQADYLDHYFLENTVAQF